MTFREWQSLSPEAAAREVGLFFPEGVVSWNASSWNWAYDPVEELPKS